MHRNALPCRRCGKMFFPASLPIHEKACSKKSAFMDLPCKHCGAPQPRRDLRMHERSCTGATSGTTSTEDGINGSSTTTTTTATPHTATAPTRPARASPGAAASGGSGRRGRRPQERKSPHSSPRTAMDGGGSPPLSSGRRRRPLPSPMRTAGPEEGDDGKRRDGCDPGEDRDGGGGGDRGNGDDGGSGDGVGDGGSGGRGNSAGGGESKAVAGSPVADGRGGFPCCTVCGRTFSEARIGTHQRICNKASPGRPRHPFDSASQRAVEGGSPHASSYGGSPGGRGNRSMASAAWRRKHRRFLASIGSHRSSGDSDDRGSPSTPPVARSPGATALRASLAATAPRSRPYGPRSARSPSTRSPAVRSPARSSPSQHRRVSAPHSMTSSGGRGGGRGDRNHMGLLLHVDEDATLGYSIPMSPVVSRGVPRGVPRGGGFSPGVSRDGRGKGPAGRVLYGGGGGGGGGGGRGDRSEEGDSALSKSWGGADYFGGGGGGVGGRGLSSAGGGARRARRGGRDDQGGDHQGQDQFSARSPPAHSSRGERTHGTTRRSIKTNGPQHGVQYGQRGRSRPSPQHRFAGSGNTVPLTLGMSNVRAGSGSVSTSNATSLGNSMLTNYDQALRH
jgi:hypothetical protein